MQITLTGRRSSIQEKQVRILVSSITAHHKNVDHRFEIYTRTSAVYFEYSCTETFGAGEPAVAASLIDGLFYKLKTGQLYSLSENYPSVRLQRLALNEQI